MSKKYKTAKKHSSGLISMLLNEITPLEELQVHTKMLLAARLDDLIMAAGMSKSAFAVLVNKQPSEITKWLSGTHNFTIDTLCEIALALNIPLADLFSFQQSEVVNKVQIIVSAKVARPDFPFTTPIITCNADHYYYKTKSGHTTLLPVTSITT